MLEIIMTQDTDLSSIMQEYEKDHDLKNFGEKMKELAGLLEKAPVSNTSTNVNSNESSEPIMSSPNDAAMMRMKKKRAMAAAQSSGSSNPTSNKKVEEVKNEESSTGFDHGLCEEGLSPKITFKKKINKDNSDSDDNY